MNANGNNSIALSTSSQKGVANRRTTSFRRQLTLNKTAAAAAAVAGETAAKEGALAPKAPRFRRRTSCSSSSSSSSFASKLHLFFLLVLLCLGTPAQSKPVQQHQHHHRRSSGSPSSRSTLESTQNKANFNKQQLISRYNFHCIGPNDVKPHSGFTSEPPPTTNASLTELRNDLYYIRSMAQELKSIHGMGTTVGENSIDGIDARQTLPNLPNPIPLDDQDDINYSKAFNRSNHLLMEYLNGIAQAELSMMESARLDGRLFNITDIEYELAAWLHKLHLKMIQNSVDIDCEGIKALLQRAPPKPLSKVHRKVYVPLLMRKLMHIMGNVIAMFDRAIQNQSAEDKRKAEAKRGSERFAGFREYGVSKRREGGQSKKASSLAPRYYRESREVEEDNAVEAVPAEESRIADESAVQTATEDVSKYTWPNFNRKRSYTQHSRSYTQPKYSSLWEEDEEY